MYVYPQQLLSGFKPLPYNRSKHIKIQNKFHNSLYILFFVALLVFLNIFCMVILCMCLYLFVILYDCVCVFFVFNKCLYLVVCFFKTYFWGIFPKTVFFRFLYEFLPETMIFIEENDFFGNLIFFGLHKFSILCVKIDRILISRLNSEISLEFCSSMSSKPSCLYEQRETTRVVVSYSYMHYYRILIVNG